MKFHMAMIDGRARHLYQPGWLLVYVGLEPPSYGDMGPTSGLIPRGVRFHPSHARTTDPVARWVDAEDGTRFFYDRLVSACGLAIDLEAISGFHEALERPDSGVGCVYLGAEGVALAGRMVRNAIRGSARLFFTRSETEMKCAGAPLKHAFFAEDAAARAGRRSSVEIIYAMSQQALFIVPIVAEWVRNVVREAWAPGLFAASVEGFGSGVSDRGAGGAG